MKKCIIKVLFATLFAAMSAHAQVTVAPSAVTMYPGRTTNVVVTLDTDWTVISTLGDAAHGLSVTWTAPTLAITTSATAANGAVSVTASNTVTDAVLTQSVPVTLRAFPVITSVTPPPKHNGDHYNSNPNTATNVAVVVNSSVTKLGAWSNAPTTFTVTATNGTTGVTIQPVLNATGSGTLYVVGYDEVLGGAVTNSATVIKVEPCPTLGLAKGTGYHGADSHIDSGTATATVIATLSPSADTYVNSWVDNTARISNVARAGTTLTLTSPANASSGAVTLYAVWKNGSTGSEVTNSIALSVVAIPRVTISNYSFNEDTIGTNNFTLAFGDAEGGVSYNAEFSPRNETHGYDIIQSYSISGTSPSKRLILTPVPDAYGVVTNIFTATANGHSTIVTNIITVLPVADPPKITGLPAQILISNRDPWTNAFANVVITDPDDFPPPPPSSRYIETLKVMVEEESEKIFFNYEELSVAVTPYTRTTDLQTQWLQSLLMRATRGFIGIIGTTNTYQVVLIATGTDTLATTNKVTVKVGIENIPPDFEVTLKNMGNDFLFEGELVQPFCLDYLTPVNKQMTLSVQLAPESEAFGFIGDGSEDRVEVGYGYGSALDDALRNIAFTAYDTGAMTNDAETLYFIFEMYDGTDTTVVTNSMLTLIQKSRKPVITLGGVTTRTITSETDTPTLAFPSITVTDDDEGGKQYVRVEIDVAPEYITLSTNAAAAESLTSPPVLSSLLREVTFLPNLSPGSALDLVGIGQHDAVITITPIDRTGLAGDARTVTVKVNKLPRAPALGVPVEQPLYFPENTPIYPFADITLVNHDAGDVSLTFKVDNPLKGTFSGITVGGGVTAVPNGFQVTAPTVDAVLSVVTNVVFKKSGSFEFPDDDPGGTTFTLAAQNLSTSLSTSRAISIRVQNPPRNWLVVKLLDDGLPGSLSHAIENYGNDDVITFALDEYPAVIRLKPLPVPGSEPVIKKALTIKGPGADMLTVSGDTGMIGDPGRRFLTVNGPLTIEGLTLADCVSEAGGALSVGLKGRLFLRGVEFRNCFADDCGGAIDVNYGMLEAESCRFIGNATGTAARYGGGAVSLYTLNPVSFLNCVFAGNIQCGYLEDSLGGGAIAADYPGSPLGAPDLDIVHCTFTGNWDLALDTENQATSIIAVGGAKVFMENNIFEDDAFALSPGGVRTLNRDIAARLWTLGGNICNNAATTYYRPNGAEVTEDIFIHENDRVEFDAFLDSKYIPQNPALISVAAALPLDFRGSIRDLVSIPGALDPKASAFPAITEIQLAGAPSEDRFIEIYAPRGQVGDVNLKDMKLLVNDVHVHTFGEGTIANPAPSTFFTDKDAAATVPASYTFPSGHGVVIAFPAHPEGTAKFQQPMATDTLTPVVRASVKTNAADFAALLSESGRGSVAIVTSNDVTIVRHTFLTAYNNPNSDGGTNLLVTGVQSIATKPFASGYAFVPHTYDSTLNESPGAENIGTPFGAENAPPIARNDSAVTTEDDATNVNALANDSDPDNDPIFILRFDASSALGAAVTLDSATGMLRYDPTGNPSLQALPAGSSRLDSFTYTILDGVTFTLDSAAASGSGPWTVTCVTADGFAHGLALSNKVWFVNGADTNRYEVSAVVNGTTFELEVDPLPAGFESGLQNSTAYTRNPVNSATATVAVTLQGLNDNPIGSDDLLAAALTEREAVRLLAQPDLAVSTTVFETSPTEVVLGVGLLANDTDVDAGDTFDTFRITGVLSSADVHPVTAIGPSPANANATRITSPAHGLASGAAVTVVGVKNPARLNGVRTVTVIDADTFEIAVASGVIDFTRAFWVPSATALTATSPLGAAVTLDTRGDPLKDSVIYDASVSAQLRKLAQGESIEDDFWYVLADQYNAPGIARVSLTVNGVNDDPVVKDEPPGLDDIYDWFGSDDLLDLLTNRVNVLTVLLPPQSGLADKADLIVADKGLANLTTASLLLVEDFYTTDERTPISIEAAELLARVTDVDTNDTHVISSVVPGSFLGAGVTLGAMGAQVTYDPNASAKLQSLGVGETAFDVFTVYVSDGIAHVEMRVAVLVRGVNNKPEASPVYVHTPVAAATVTFTPDVADVDVNDIHTLVNPPSNTVNVPNPTLMTNAIPYTVTDHSLFLAMDDTYRLARGAPQTALDVLANDVNFHGTGMTLASVTPSLRGGTVSVNPGGTALLYTPPPGFAGSDVFTYSATNSLGIVRRANVRVYLILDGFNGPLHACNDEYAVARGMSLDMPVTVNDITLPNSPAGLTVDPGHNGDWPLGLTLSGNVFHYQSSASDPSETNFTYRVVNGIGDSSEANVRIKIIDRVTGIQPDYVTAAPGAAAITLDVLANDVILGDSTEGMLVTALDTTGTAGTVAIAAGGGSVTYAAPAGFIGIDIFSYTAVDRYGAQGTTNVYVTVGIPIATKDTITVTNNAVATLIDVLANDTVFPYASPTSLTLTDVWLRPGQTANGAATVSGNKVSFDAWGTINATAIWYYTYTMPNSSLVTTGEVAITTSYPETLYASADNFTVRMNAGEALLDVLANDISYHTVKFPLSVKSVSTTTEPGGTASIVSNGTLIAYAPPPGFEGTDTFKYIVSDGTGTAEGSVTIYVVPSDLIANDDAYIIGYEWDGAAGKAKAYTLPVLGNDSVFPGGAVAINVTPNFGIGPNAPKYGSTNEVSPDTKSILFRPGKDPGTYPGNQYVETFTYEVQDAYGRKKDAHVSVTVLLRAEYITLETQDDMFNVERNSVGNVLKVAANDLVEPKTPLPPSGLHVSATAVWGDISVSGMELIYTPPSGFVGVDTASYIITDGIGGTGIGTVTIYVGALPTAVDTFSVLRGSENFLDVLPNDAITQSYLSSYQLALSSVSGATCGGAVSIAGTQIRYVPDAGWAGDYPYTEQFTYALVDQTGTRLTTGTVHVTVHDMDNSLGTNVLYVINAGGILPVSNARDLWNTHYFGGGYAIDPAAAGTADPDGDGLSNDAEYAFGCDPTVSDATAGRITIRLLSNGTADITYTRRTNDPNIVFTLHSCDDLNVGNWQPVTDDTFSFVTHSNTELIIATHNVPDVVTNPRRFFKIIVTFN